MARELAQIRMEGVAIRAMQPGDVNAVAGITQDSPEAAQWAREDFVRVARQQTAGARAWVAELAGRIVAFVVTRRVADEVEILNVAVSSSCRGGGIGRRLLQFALREAAAAGARRAFLEVRESNRAATSLYSRCGFAPSGKRARYYSAPVEDALVFSRVLTETD